VKPARVNLVDALGRIQLHAWQTPAGDLELLLGRLDQPAATELIVAITKLVDAANAHHLDGDDGPKAPKLAAWGVLHAAVEALHLAARAA
jgi:hypothetical protein